MKHSRKPKKGQIKGDVVSRKPYGRFYITGIGVTYAHKASYLIFKGEAPKGLEVLHSCDNGLCVNPAHLSVNTHKRNIEEAIERGLMSWQNGWKKPVLKRR